MKRILFIAIISFFWFAPIASAQIINPYYQTLVSGVSYDSVLHNLQQFQNYGVKSMGSQSLKNTGIWLTNKYISMGYTPIKRDSFGSGSQSSYSIIASKTGTLYPDSIVIVCGHYDTQGGPGTNDNGSGISVILEIARIIANVSTEFSVKLINFSGEESGYLGSQHYVNNILIPQNMGIRLVFNIDEVGGIAGMQNNTIRCERDNSNPPQNNAYSELYTDTLANITSLYSSLNTIFTDAYGSDYVPFENNGEYITGFYEDNESSYVHSANDMLNHLDTSYVYQVAKAATAATLYFARAYDITTSQSEQFVKPSGFKLFPNPSSGSFFIESPEGAQIYISDINGKKVFESYYSDAFYLKISPPHLEKGIYILSVIYEHSMRQETLKIIII